MRNLASIQVINNIRPINGADNIEVCSVLGWDVIVKKGQFKNDDLGIYCEIDSILPDRPEFDFLKSKRIKTIKLKGQISQGILFPITLLQSTLKYKVGDDVTEILGVKKHLSETDLEDETVEVKEKRPAYLNKYPFTVLMRYSWFRRLVLKPKKKYGWPSFIKRTDEDRIQSIPDICNKFAGIQFKATEKLDGQSGTYFIRKYKTYRIFTKFDIGVCSRNFRLKTPVVSSYWSIYKSCDMKKVLTTLFKHYKPVSTLVIQGEILGPKIQGNKYGLKTYLFKPFNLVIDGKRLDYNVLKEACSLINLEPVPLIHEGITLYPSVSENVEVSKGYSVLNSNTVREGLVYRNAEKGISFKIINPLFLLKNDE